ncbi:MAG: phosphoribosylglycinamide formyltransferase [Planctomycetota bacterium]|nr:phosphoribosylglycinamide formyltransferase [Planctomycetota bacterium]MDA1177482.1 phosphoribosylglycinamide formyltransferase [Planctomycetota bacterium]
MSRPIRLGVLISGGGTTLVNFLKYVTAGKLNAEIPLVIASTADCAGITRAREAGLNCEILARNEYSSVVEYSNAIFALCREHRVDLVTFAGFLCLLQIPDEFTDRVLNIHPSLIPAFCGKGFHGSRVHTAAIDRGVKVSGCTIHFADNQYDHGPIVLQHTVPVDPDDTPETLAKRVFAAECVAYPEAISLYASGRLWRTDDGRIIVR